MEARNEKQMFRDILRGRSMPEALREYSRQRAQRQRQASWKERRVRNAAVEHFDTCEWHPGVNKALCPCR